MVSISNIFLFKYKSSLNTIWCTSLNNLKIPFGFVHISPHCANPYYYQFFHKIKFNTNVLYFRSVKYALVSVSNILGFCEKKFQ